MPIDLNAIMKAIGKTGLAGAGKALITPDALAGMTKTGISEAAETVEEAPKKTSFLKNLGQAAGGILKKVAPIAAGFIPGIGPIASQILSTLNDDEWFGEYKAAGATFNEMLSIQARNNAATAGAGLMDIVGAVAFIDVNILSDPYWKDQVLPTILTYVRDKTDNVLNATEQQYWDAFVSASKLYAIYYNLLKYKEIMRNLPLNIPRLSTLFTVASPVNYSMLSGVIEALKGYLDSTIRLPYAWTEYIRWRFGTTFYSSNTGKPGLIMYDYINHEDAPTAIETNVIDALKAILVSTGRAVADINLAYKDHQIRFDVEVAHYDEKEFCLRSNFWANFTGPFGDFNYALVYQDSRLDSSAALQAVTISTRGNVAAAPFAIVSKPRIAFYVQDALNSIPYEDDVTSTLSSLSLAAGWYRALIPDQLNKFVVHAKADGANLYKGVIESLEVPLDTQNSSKASAALNVVLRLLAAYAADTLEFHNLAAGFSIFNDTQSKTYSYFRGKSLAYDTAYIYSTQIDSIHRIALRNLVRGNYKRKTPISTDPNIKEAVSDVVDVVTDEMKKGVTAK